MDDSTEGADILRGRKAVSPATVEREPGSVPAYFWWGIGAFERSGVPSLALAQDLRQFDGHLSFLVARCRQLSRLRDRGSRTAREIGMIALEEAREELTSAVLDLAGLGLPGVGFVWRIGSWTAGRITEARREKRLIAEGSIIREDHSQVAADAFDTIQSVSRPGLTIVVVVEDLQYADDTLIDLLARLTSSGKPILVITTAWPGVFEDSPALARVAESNARLVRLSTARPAPDGWPALLPLEHDALATIIRDAYPFATDRTIAALIRRSESPLQLRLLCALPSVVRQAEDGRLDLDPEFVAALPHSLDGMYEQLWTQLPEAVRESLALALCGIPTDVDTGGGSGDDRWDAELLSRVARNLFPAAPGLVDAIDSAQTGYAWAELVEGALRVFPDEANRRVVERRRPEFYSMLDVARIRGELTRAIGEELNSDTIPDHIRQHRAALLLALSAEGFEVDESALVSAADVQAELLEAAGEPERVIDVIDHVAQALSPMEAPQETAAPVDEADANDDKTRVAGEPAPDPIRLDPPNLARPRLGARLGLVSLELRLRRAVASARSGRVHDVAAELDDIVEAATGRGGPDDPVAIDARIERLELAGRAPAHGEPADDPTELEGAVQRVFGPADARSLRLLRVQWEQPSRYENGALPGAVTGWAQLQLAQLADRFGPSTPELVSFHALVAHKARTGGYPDVAVTFLDKSIRDLAGMVGAEHPEVLRLRLERARSLVACDRAAEALAEARAVHAMFQAASGFFDRDTVDALTVAVTVSAATDADTEDAADVEREATRLLEEYPHDRDQTPLLRLKVAQMHVQLKADDDPSDDLLGQALDLLGHAGEVLGEEDDDVRELFLATAEALLSTGRTEAAFALLEPAMRVAAYRRAQPPTWRTAMLLGSCHELLDRPAEAVTAYTFAAEAAEDTWANAQTHDVDPATAPAMSNEARSRIDQVQRATPNGWYPTGYVDIRPWNAVDPYRGVLPMFDRDFLADDEQLLRLEQHHYGRTLIYGPAERTTLDMLRTLLRYRLNRDDHAEAISLTRSLLTMRHLPGYALRSGASGVDGAERALLVYDAIRSATALGQAESVLDLVDDAIAAAETLEQRADLLDDKATLLEDLERTDSALAVLDELTDFTPAAGRRAMSQRRVDLLLRAGRSDDALQTLQRMVEEETNSPERDALVDQIMSVLDDLERPEERIATARTALESSPSSARRARLTREIADALHDLERGEEAIAVLTEALADPTMTSERVALLRRRAWLLSTAGDRDEDAADDLYEILREHPGDSFAKIALVDPLVRLQRLNEATEMFVQSVQDSRRAGLTAQDFHLRLTVLKMVVQHGNPTDGVDYGEEFLMLLESAPELGSFAKVLRKLAGDELAKARSTPQRPRRRRTDPASGRVTHGAPR